MNDIKEVGVGRAHPHCCGGLDYEGFNNSMFTPARVIHKLLVYVKSYQAPMIGNPEYSGCGFVNMVGASQPFGQTHAELRRRIKAFKEYIKKHDLGTLTVCKEVGNPNYKGNHRLIPMIFFPNNENMRQYGIKKKILKPLPCDLGESSPKDVWHDLTRV